MKYLLATLLLLVTTAVNAQTINLQPTASAVVGRDSYIVVKLDTKDTVWDVIGDKASYSMTQQKLADSADILFVFNAKAEGAYTLVVSGATGDKVVMKKCTITATKDPAPPPVPDDAVLKELKAIRLDIQSLTERVKALEGSKPPPSPKEKPAHITFIGATKTEKALATNNDPELRQWLAGKGLKVHVLKSEDPAIKTSGLTEAVATAGGEPCVVAQDAKGNVLGSARLTSVDSVKAFVRLLLDE